MRKYNKPTAEQIRATIKLYKESYEFTKQDTKETKSRTD